MKKIVATNGSEYVGVEQVEGGLKTCLVKTPTEALNYKIMILWVIKPFVLRKLKKQFGCDFEFKKFEIVTEEESKRYAYVIAQNDHYIAEKSFVYNEDTNINDLTLEQLNALSAIGKEVSGNSFIKYLGVVDNVLYAQKYDTKPKKHLKIAEAMYGDGWEIKKIEV